MLRSIFVLAVTLLVSASMAIADNGVAADSVVPIWPDQPPDWDAPDQLERDTTGPEDRKVAGRRVTRLGFVARPQLHVYRATDRPSDTTILVCPGGGYSILAWDLEGTEIARWLQSIGVTAIVVKYRVPNRDRDPKWLAPVQDIQRSVSLIRSGAIEGVAPKTIGILGFSAGGNASVRVATAGKRHYASIDRHDDTSATPDFAILVYPAWLVKEDDPGRLIEEIKVTAGTPPMFFAHAADDRHTCMSSVSLFAALRAHGVPSSLHVFASGGHGFGGRIANQPTDAWRELCADWLRTRGWLKT